MASRLSFQIDFQGLDTVLAKLKLINKELANMGRFGGGGNAAASANVSRNSGAGGSFAGSFIGASAGNLLGNSSRRLIGAGASRNLLGAGSTEEQGLQLRNAFVQAYQNYKSKASAFGQFVMGGGAGSGGGGIPPVIPGGAAGGGAGMSAAALKSLALVATTLTTAFWALLGAVKVGASAFIEAARTGHAVGDISQLTSALGIIGISETATQRMLLEAERNAKSRKFGVEGTNMVVSAARASGFGNVQQLMNMSQQFAQAMDDVKTSSEQIDKVSGTNLQTSILWNETVVQFKTLIAQLAADMAPLLQIILALTHELLKLLNMIAEFGLEIAKKLGLTQFFGSDLKPGQNRLPPIGGRQSAAGTFQNIGFVFNSGGPEKKLEEIANNTKQTVTLLTVLKHDILKERTRIHGFSLPGLP